MSTFADSVHQAIVEEEEVEAEDGEIKLDHTKSYFPHLFPRSISFTNHEKLSNLVEIN